MAVAEDTRLPLMDGRVRLRPLVLSAKRQTWRMADDHSASHDKAFRAIRKVVLERDNHACQFCGFRAAKWQEVHHLNDDHADNRPENLITACWFCHMVHHIGRVGLFDEGRLIYAPELGQADIFHLMRSCMVVARHYQVLQDRKVTGEQLDLAAEWFDAAVQMHSLFETREVAAREYIGTSSLLALGEALLEIPDDAYEKRAEILMPLRLLPTGAKRDAFGAGRQNEIIDSWLSPGGPYHNLPPTIWRKLYEDALVSFQAGAAGGRAAA